MAVGSGMLSILGGMVEGVAEGFTREKMEARADGTPHQKVGRGVGFFAGKQMKRLYLEDCRAHIFQDLTEMEWEEKNKLIGFLKAARLECNETELVDTLAKIPPDPIGSRKDGLKHINDTLPGHYLQGLKRTDESRVLMELLLDNGMQQKVEQATKSVRGLRAKLAARRVARGGRP